MKKFIFIFVLSLTISGVEAQEKVKFSKKNFSVLSIIPSEYFCLDDMLTQTTIFQLADKLPVAERNLKRDYFDIEGYIKDPENGKLKIYVSIPPPKFEKSIIDSSLSTETRKLYYFAALYFKVLVKIEVKCQSQTIYTEEFISSERIDYEEFITKSEVKKAINEIEMKNEYGVQMEQSINHAMTNIEQILNQKLRYSTQRNKETFVFLTSKEHPEYQQMLDFEHEITAQMQNITLEKGFNYQNLAPYLVYLETLLTKYPASPENTKIRFIASNNLAQLYFLLENSERTFFFSDVLIKNDFRKSWGQDLIDRTKRTFFVNKKVRTHTPRFMELAKLGFKMEQDVIQEKEDARLAFFEKIERDITDWEQEKVNRLGYIEAAKNKRLNLLDSVQSQSNAKILEKVIEGLGGGQILKGVEKVHTLSKLTFEDSNVPSYEEKWGSAFTNYLLKKKNPDNFYVVVNQVESWQHDDRVRGEKWKKMSNTDYLEVLRNLDPMYLLSSFRLDLWNNYELLEDATSDGQLCFHLKYVEKVLNSNNRNVPKTEHHLYIEKEKYRVVSSEKFEFEDGKKTSFERKIYQDYRELISLNSGAVPHRILYQIEDFYGDTFYQEQIEKIEINSGFANRIFIKEIYVGGFK